MYEITLGLAHSRDGLTESIAVALLVIR